MVRESSFNMTRAGGMKILRGGLRKFLDTRRGGSEKIVALGGGALKIHILQNQHMTSYRSDGFQLNNLMTCATQLYHVVYRCNKCSLSNIITLLFILKML